MQVVAIRTSKGLIWVAAPPASERPVLFFLHGLFRATSRPGFAELFPGYDVAYGLLPGHGGAPVLDDCSIDAMGRAFMEVLTSSLFAGRQILFVGESVGGVVGVRVGTFQFPGLTGVVALDPFWTTSKLWMMPAVLRDAAASYPGAERLMEDVFGLQSATDRVYYPMLGYLQVPLTVICGDAPLNPQRKMDDAPSLTDAGDEWVLRRFPKVTLHRIPGTHRLLDHSPQVVAGLVKGAQRHDRHNAADVA